MNEEINEKVIANYQRDEKIMILIYAQWCINNELDPRALYQEAYPQQMHNAELEEVIEEQTVSKAEADPIDDATVLSVLQLFGNDDLAFAVQNRVQQKKKQ